jgi:hypothetical protein
MAIFNNSLDGFIDIVIEINKHAKIFPAISTFMLATGGMNLAMKYHSCELLREIIKSCY